MEVRHVSAGRPLTVAVMDPCAMGALGLKTLLESHEIPLRVEFTVNSVQALTERVRMQPVDLIVSASIGLGETFSQTIAGLQQLKERYSRLQLLVFTGPCEGHLVAQLKTLAPAGLFSKDETIETLHKGLHVSLTEKGYVSPKLQDALKHKPEGRRSRLTPMEQKVLNYLLSGLTVEETARIMNRAPRTITTHKGNAMHKLGTRNDAALVMLRDLVTTQEEQSAQDELLVACRRPFNHELVAFG